MDPESNQREIRWYLMIEMCRIKLAVFPGHGSRVVARRKEAEVGGGGEGQWVLMNMFSRLMKSTIWLRRSCMDTIPGHWLTIMRRSLTVYASRASISAKRSLMAKENLVRLEKDQSWG